MNRRREIYKLTITLEDITHLSHYVIKRSEKSHKTIEVINKLAYNRSSLAASM